MPRAALDGAPAARLACAMRSRLLGLVLLAGVSAACGRGTLLPADLPAIEVAASSPAAIRAGILEGLSANAFTVDTEA